MLAFAAQMEPQVPVGLSLQLLYDRSYLSQFEVTCHVKIMDAYGL